jgi:glucose-fructose oxidoreductase
MKTPSRFTRREFLAQASLAAAALAARPLFAADPPPARKLGIALVGLGSYATHQLAPAFRDTRYCRLAGIVTGTPAKAERWRRRYELPAGSVYSYDTMERVADNPDIDILYVVTPPGTHRDLVVRAARAGKHVICEKPMAVSVAECDEMIEACRKAGRKLSIGYRLQFEPHHIAMEQFARGAATGPARRMRGAHGFRIGGGVWRVEKKLAGGGPLPDVGIYVIQSACRAAGAAPVAVVAHEEPKTRPEVFRDVEEAMRWTMEFPNGALAEGFTSYSEGANEFRVETDHGWFELDPAFPYGGIRARTNRGRVEVPNIDQQAAQMDDFARCILENRDTPVPGEMGRRDIAIMEAIYASAAARGERIAVKA